MGYVASQASSAGTGLEVTIVGERRSCRVLGQAAVDPAGARMRA
jgi:glycine cleavage system aminomethyltransferase T